MNRNSEPDLGDGLEVNSTTTPIPSLPSEKPGTGASLHATVRWRTGLVIAVSALLAAGALVLMRSRNIPPVASGSVELVPQEHSVKAVARVEAESVAPPAVPAATIDEKKMSPAELKSAQSSTAGGGGDPRARVTSQGVLGIINGQRRGRSVASADIFGKGGYATDIDAILSGVGGLKAGGGGGIGRKGAAGIGYGAGYGGAVGAVSASPNYNNERYDFINENDYRVVTDNPLSTFSIDVDVASYSNVRRFIENGSLPPPDAVRIEEMINYFSYSYREPQGNDPFSVTVEMAGCPWSSAHRIALVGVQGKQVDIDNVPPSNLVFLIDVSGSMQAENKLPLVQKSLNLLVDQLREQDRIAITVYAGSAGTVLPSTPGSNKQRIRESINRLKAGGSTAGAYGIELAYETAAEHFIRGGNNRVILATDGDFNVGASSDEELVSLIEQKRDKGIYLTVLGFGTGNYKDAKMEKLADKGNGNYAYIDKLSEAKKVLVEEMSGTLLTIAKDVKIQIEFNPAQVHSYRLIGYENRIMKKEEFNDDRKDAGELGAGHRVTALYEIITNDNGHDLQVDPLRYQHEKPREVQPGTNEFTDEIMLVKLRYKRPDESKSNLIRVAVRESEVQDKLSENLLFASAVAGFGMLLRGSRYKGDVTWAQVALLARVGRGKDLSGYRKEFISMVDKCKSIVH